MRDVVHLGVAVLCALVLRTAAQPDWEPVPILDVQLRQNYLDKSPSKSEAPGAIRLRAGVDVQPWTPLQLRFQWQANGDWDGGQEGEGSYEALSESWVSLSDIAYLPLSLKAGRQFVVLEQSLLFGGAQDKDWLYDGAGLTYDLVDRDWSFLCAEPAHVSPDTDWEQLAILYGHREWRRQAESSVGLTALEGRDEAWAGVLSAQSQLRMASGLEFQIFAAVQGGELETGQDQLGWLVNARLERSWPGTYMQPACIFQFTEASGDSDEDQSQAFRPMFNEEVFGRVLSPALSNIRITRMGLSLEPMDHISAGVDLRYYSQQQTWAGVTGQQNFQEPGLSVPTSGRSDDLGWEGTAHAQWEANDYMRTRAHAAVFFPGDAYDEADIESAIFEARVELIVTY